MRLVKFQIVVVVFIAYLFFMAPVSAHPGRTDASGCHTCRTNCGKWGLSQGEYHCHRAKELPQPKEPIKSHFSETGGYTSPAPEYKEKMKPVEKVKRMEKVATPPAETIKTPVKNVEKPKVPEKEKSWVMRVWNSILELKK